MNAHGLNLMKRSLLGELDASFQHCYREHLSEIINDLRLHFVSISPDPSPDEVFAVIRRVRLLDHMPETEGRDLRHALERMANGTYGICARCGREIDSATLAQEPTAAICGRCADRTAA